MHVIIVGAGEVGFHIAERLSKEGHDITIIERDEDKERLIRTKLDAMIIAGSGASAESLEAARIDHAELFIAVTDLDEVNLISCLLANEYRVPRIIARSKSLEYAGVAWRHNARKLGVDMIINPQSVVADEISSAVAHAEASEVAEFVNGRIVFLGYPITEESPLNGISLKTVGSIRGIYRLIITALTREDETIVPRGDDVIQAGDTLYFVCNKSDLPAISELFGFGHRKNKNIFVLGAGGVGFEVARRLVEHNYRVKVIDRNVKNCDRMARDLGGVLVLNTDGTDVETLNNEGIDSGDVFIAVTQDDKTNILCSLLAKRNGCRSAIALVNRPEFVTLAPSLGIDHCISPRLATASAILKYVRRGDVVSMEVLEQSDAEVLELLMPGTSSILGKPLKSLSVPLGAIIGAIARQDEVIIPSGDDHLEEGDHVIIFSLPEAVTKVEKFFSN